MRPSRANPSPGTDLQGLVLGTRAPRPRPRDILGRLTRRTFGLQHGKLQSYELGCALRDRYDDFLGKGYRPEDLYARSSNYDRTKMSLQLVLAGLYPPTGDQIWNSNLNWMPIPYEYKLMSEDILLLPFFNKRYQRYLAEAQNLLATREKLKKIQETYESLSELKAITDRSFSLLEIPIIFNILHIHKIHNKTLPNWCSNNLYDILKDLFVDCLHIMSMTTEQRKLSGGLMIKEFLQHFHEEINKKKIYLYSGHDLTLSVLMSSHNIENLEYLDFSNALILEKLTDSQNKLYVRFLMYDGKEFKNLKIWNQEDICPIDEYLKIVKNNIPSDDDIASMLNEGCNHLLEGR